jgi:phosphatidylserine decarboxylase
MGITSKETDEPQEGFKNFSDFFGRRLRPGARTICEDPDVVVSPSDGEILDFGQINSTKSPAFSIKGSSYNVDSLLGKDGGGEAYRGGGYMVVYLHLRDYHRVHVPTASALEGMRHVPGARYPVNNWLREKVDCIYNKNERTVFHFALPTKGELSVVMVAAFGVGNIETRFPLGSEGSDICRERYFNPPVELTVGEELGAFLLGSTVVMLWSKGALDLDREVVQGPVAMGRRLGKINK